MGAESSVVSNVHLNVNVMEAYCKKLGVSKHITGYMKGRIVCSEEFHCCITH